MKALTAEMVGTFTYVMAIAWTALLGGSTAETGLAVALAAGLSYTAMCFALGVVAGCHFNPAITLGLVAAGRFDTRSAIPYILAQVAGALLAGALTAWLVAVAPTGAAAPLTAIANRFDTAGTFPFVAVLTCETIAAALLLMLFVGATSSGVPPGFAPISLGLFIAILHLALQPISQAAINPARSTGLAVFSDLEALLQLWLFWVAPIVGAVIGGLIGRWYNEE